MKSFKNSLKVIILFSLVVLVSNCASYKPTTIENGYQGSISEITISEKVGILCSYHYLKKVDKLEGSKKAKTDRDQRIAKAVVDEQLNILCGYNSSCLGNFTTTNNTASISTDPYVDLKIYQKVTWGDLAWILFPVYYSVNESICVTAEIYENNSVTKTIEEWGYMKDAGFWFWSFPEKPNSIELRRYLVQKVLDQTVKELD